MRKPLTWIRWLGAGAAMLTVLGGCGSSEPPPPTQADKAAAQKAADYYRNNNPKGASGKPRLPPGYPGTYPGAH